MQSLYWFCEPPHKVGGLIWPVTLRDNMEKRKQIVSRFIPSKDRLQSDVMPFIKASCGPLYFATALEKGKGRIIDNGSFGLVGTCKKDLLVTCYHVWNGFLDARKKIPSLKLCACLDDKYPVTICTLPDGTENKPIAQDEELDIAAFDLEPFKQYCGEHKTCALSGIEPRVQLNEKDAVGIVGHPGRFRAEVKDGVQFGREPYCGFISSISGCKFLVDFTRVMDCDRNLLVKKWDRDNTPTRGISGSPCFIINSNYQLSLVGFVTAHRGWNGIPNNFIQVTMSDCINEDGTLRSVDSFHPNR